MDKALLLLILGWLLSEVSHLLRTGRDQRVAIGQTLTELLAIRRLLLAVTTVPKQLAQRLGAPPQVEVWLRVVLSNFLPGLEDLRKRYDQALDGLAGAAPVLAYRLRGSADITPLLNRLAALAAQDPAATAAWPELEADLLKRVMPELEDRIREAARLHGLWTQRAVRGLLKKSLTVPVELVDQILSRLPKNPAAPKA